MLAREDNREQWEELALPTFLEMLRAKDGDLEVVSKLFNIFSEITILSYDVSKETSYSKYFLLIEKIPIG